MRLGSFVTTPTSWPITKDSALSAQFQTGTPLFKVALQWLREDKAYREELENQGLRKTRGRRIEVLFITFIFRSVSKLSHQAVPSDSETFYRK